MPDRPDGTANDLSRTRANQRKASHPGSSAWVIANAGSGKTHVLTQRVIRLLLSGVDPAAILCLTFTKVAAAEMSRRVFRDLGAWTSLDDAALGAAIAELEGAPPTAAQMRRARRLFAKALETPGGLNIQTIHAFCERLLHAFPFEANVPGQFQVMDESATAAALAAAREQVMNQAAAAPDSPLGEAVRRLAVGTADQQIGEALDALIARRDDLRRWAENAALDGAAGSIDDVLADLRRRLGLADDETEDSVCRAMCDAPGWSRAECAELAALLGSASGKNDRAAGAELGALADAADAALGSKLRQSFFLTKDGLSGLKARSATTRFSKAVRGQRSGLEEDFTAEAERLLALLARLGLVHAYDETAALLVVGDAILAAYHQAKRRAGALDFSDLIVKTRNLLSRSDAAQWVLFKLDSRIEHILVDEAQDTSPDQWTVVKAIAEDFFSGEGAARAPRTIFVVGDDKQSIFRFQGAVPAMLSEMQDFFEKRIIEARQSLVVTSLYLSFRSTHEVLAAVDKVFSNALAGEITASSYTAHASHRTDEPGHVVLLPRVARQKREDPEDWTEPYTAPSAAETELAEDIAAEIERLIGTVLPSGKRVTESGILVLVRRRDAFAAAMNRALLARNIATAGTDRIAVSKHIAVLDLLAIADVMLLPDDDLQLAAALKSPLLGLDEAGLMRLAMDRGRKSLWRALNAASEEPCARIAARLRGWRDMADRVTPFRFFATILGPDHGRRLFRARLGGEVDDVLDAFLSQALAYEATEPPSLHGFLRFIRANESDIRRETEEAAAGVRVMTVHGAKGLEADIVFLADTGGAAVVHQLRKPLVDIGKDRDHPAFLWRRIQAEASELQRNADQREDCETEREYLRLLYVAMTRARDVLYVAGVKSLLKKQPRTWYSIVDAALVPTDIERDEEGNLVAPYLWPPERRPPAEPEGGPTGAEEEPTEIPPWLTTPALAPPRPPEPLRPSGALAEPDLPPPGLEGGAPGERGRLRGRLLHRLLQVLPAWPEPERPRAAERLIGTELADEPDLLQTILAEAEAVLAAPELARFFGPESRAEVAIVGELSTARGQYAVSGRIDRLVRDAAGWHLLDFKTDRRVPATPAEADPAYILQTCALPPAPDGNGAGCRGFRDACLHRAAADDHANPGRNDGTGAQ